MAEIVYLSDSIEFDITLIEERLTDIERIMSVFDSVYPKSIEQWVSNFLGAVNPHKEINSWLNIAELYCQFTAGLSFETREDVFERIFLVSEDARFGISHF